MKKFLDAARAWTHTASPVRIALVLALTLKLIYATAAAALAPGITIDPKMVASNALTENLMQQSGSAVYRLSGVWERFDTLWYLHIAQFGYDRADAVVFFPLYPMLIRALSVVLTPIQSALLISFFSAWLFFWALFRLAEMDFGRSVAVRTLLVVAAWPASFTLFAGYADSLVLGLMLAALYWSRVEKQSLALPAAMLAGLAKAVGVFIAVPIAFYAWKRRAWTSFAAAIAPGVGYAIFLVYLRMISMPAPSEVYARYWRTEVSTPWATIAEAVRHMGDGNPILLFNVAALATVVFLCRKNLSLPYLAYAGAVLLLFLTKKTDPVLQSTCRYLIAVFPAFIYLATTKVQLKHVLAPAAVLNLLLMTAFLKWWLIV